MRFLLLLLLPIGDIYLLVVAGRHFGLWPVLGFVLASTVVGGALARREGGRIARQIERARADGHAPAEGMLSAAMAAMAGAMLAFPGPVSTAAGLALLLPPVRRAIGRLAQRWFERRLAAFGGFTLDPGGGEWPGAAPSSDRDDVIDIEAREVKTGGPRGSANDHPRLPDSDPDRS